MQIVKVRDRQSLYKVFPPAQDLAACWLAAPCLLILSESIYPSYGFTPPCTPMSFAIWNSISAHMSNALRAVC